MDVAAVWSHIDRERSELADLFERLTPAQWEQPSLCTGWRVRDVAAHLTLAHMGVRTALPALVRSGFSFDRMIRDTALRQARLPTDAYAPLLREMVGSRRTAPLISPLEPLTDVLVHGQDICLPLGIRREMPGPAAAASADRVWSMAFPFRARKRLAGVHLRSTDHPWEAGQGPVAEGPLSSVLLLLTGRPAGLEALHGPGADLLRQRAAA